MATPGEEEENARREVRAAGEAVILARHAWYAAVARHGELVGRLAAVRAQMRETARAGGCDSPGPSISYQQDRGYQ
ncbi:MAG TPA: hypothetical protein VHT94_07280 [Streptosporangiaceae bacterium]|jgi:hypothetical protein|nr:hypothetical protein [Streptosporangiaceae bacterium]